jgi:hypothetical protein
MEEPTEQQQEDGRGPRDSTSGQLDISGGLTERDKERRQRGKETEQGKYGIFFKHK